MVCVSYIFMYEVNNELVGVITIYENVKGFPKKSNTSRSTKSHDVRTHHAIAQGETGQGI